jgi:cobalamin biosynthesis Mg chelatase CobN
VRDGVERELAASATAVTVAAQTINFFADTGRVQVTVLNGLDVPVQDVRVRLVPGNPRLRIEGETKTVSIGAKSRTTVTYQATALAAGPVTIEALVTGPNGTAVGPTTRMLVRVTPTGAAVYWILGAIIVVVFALGLWRNIRSRRRSDADAVGPETPNAIQVDEEEPR